MALGKTLLTILLSAFIFELVAQPIYFDKRERREYYIYRDSDPELIEDYLKSVNAEAIDFSPYDETFTLKNKEGKWNLYNDLNEQVTFKGYDSMGFVTPDVPYTVVKNTNKYGILKSPFEFENIESDIKMRFNAIKMVKKDGKNYLIAKKGRKWAQLDWKTGVNYTPFIYMKFKDIEFKELSDAELAFMAKIRRKKGFDYVEFDRVNKSEIYMARQSRLRKWGILKGFDPNTSKELVPVEFDSLDFFPSNKSFTAAYLGGKIAFFNYIDGNVKKISEPIYEDYKSAEFNDMLYLAVKRQGKWGWMDWTDGEIKIKSISPSFDKLPQPDWKPKAYN